MVGLRLEGCPQCEALRNFNKARPSGISTEGLPGFIDTVCGSQHDGHGDDYLPPFIRMRECPAKQGQEDSSPKLDAVSPQLTYLLCFMEADELISRAQG